MELATNWSTMEELNSAEEIIITELPENQFATKAAQYALLGKIYTEKSLSKKVIKSMIKKGWGNPKGLSIVDISPNIFLFNFTDLETSNRILEKAPWNILGQVLILKQWNPQISVHEIDFTHAPYWIQIHGMPLEFFSKQNAAHTGSKIGEVIDVEDPFHGTTIKRSFLRVRVLLNTKNPLPAGFWIPRLHFPKIWVQLRYEKLMDYCYNCGRLRHDQRACRHKRALDAVNFSKPMYGPWLGVPLLKKLGIQRMETATVVEEDNPDGDDYRKRDTEPKKCTYDENGNYSGGVEREAGIAGNLHQNSKTYQHATSSEGNN